ncbi:PAXNEB-domain-containing protein [Lojkania enalia]|uniref:Elongator complex protein 4 n=1 Tax=Lojkania enalia TaxID=147567 RepID=A0A9P4K0K0_9PLEO|nr:PAXNEB-domain-containing protein [Didymosphaeria enalia]
MAFRKRNIPLSRAGEAPQDPSSSPTPTTPQSISGTRPSPIDGRLTTSTGTPSLDNILAGHAGLALGTSLFIGESGTTDYAGILLRFYAAEGVVQGHKVHVVGLGEWWGRDLPGLAGSKGEEKRREAGERMKIAWRYEGLGEFGSRGSPAPNRATAQAKAGDAEEPAAFCHIFDLAKRLELPVQSVINYITVPATAKDSPFVSVLQNLQRQIACSPPNSIHRLLIPGLLSPATYPLTAAQPQYVLQFLHALRALLRQYPTRLAAMFTLPLTLYPRSTGLVRWMEILSDGVLELSPFPNDRRLSTSGAATQEEERPQGMFAVHKLPIYHEKGGGGGAEWLGEDLAFTVSRRKFMIAKFSLPPVEGDTEAQQGGAQESHGGVNMPSKAELDF